MPHLGQRVQTRLLPVAFQRMPPISQIGRSNPQDGQRTIQERESASIEAAQEGGTRRVINRWKRLCGFGPSVTLDSGPDDRRDVGTLAPLDSRASNDTGRDRRADTGRRAGAG